MRAKLKTGAFSHTHMSGRDRLAIPTLKLREEDLLRAAREADARALAAEAAAVRSTTRPSAGPEIDVSIEPLEDNLDVEALLGQTSEDLPQIGPPSETSDIRPTWRSEDGPALTSVPYVAVSKEDLSWFELEATSDVVLAMIDGESTVESIVDRLTIPRESALAILRELGSHGVVAFH
jgi:hypothetical protein